MYNKWQVEVDNDKITKLRSGKSTIVFNKVTGRRHKDSFLNRIWDWITLWIVR